MGTESSMGDESSSSSDEGKPQVKYIGNKQPTKVGTALSNQLTQTKPKFTKTKVELKKIQ